MEHKHTPGRTQGTSEDAHNLRLMNRALARSDAELHGYRLALQSPPPPVGAEAAFDRHRSRMNPQERTP